MHTYVAVRISKTKSFMSGPVQPTARTRVAICTYSTANKVLLYGYSVNPNNDLIWLFVKMQSETLYKTWLGYETKQFLLT